MSEFKLGRHISIGQQLSNTPFYAKNLGYDIFQIFLSVPQKILTKARQKDVLIEMGKELNKYRIKMVVHGSYIINLCHDKNSKKYDLSLKSLIQDLNATNDIGRNCLGVIIHMGKNIPENKLTNEQALNNYIVGIKDALSQTPDSTCIILETGASQGSEIGSKLNGLSEIYWNLTNHERNRIMFCIDTCHIWATGYDISDKIGVKTFFEKFNDKIGLEKIACIHFNDSKTDLNSHVYRLADLGYGFIKAPGLKAVARFAKKNNIPLIMETPLDAINIKTNKEITLEEELKTVNLWLNNIKK